MNEIAPQVYCLDGSVNMYLCVADDGVTLIDTGMPRSLPRVLAAMQELGQSPERLQRIVITHADIDHAGSAAALQAATGAAIWTGQATADLLVKGRSPRHMPWYAQFIIDWFIRYGRVPATALQIFQEGDELPVLGGLQVHFTPGHTLDHHSLFSPASRILFAGDALNTRKNTLSATPERITADSVAAREAALKLLALNPSVIACGHGIPLSGEIARQQAAQLLEVLK